MPSRKHPGPASANGRPADAAEDAASSGELTDLLAAAEQAEAEAAEAAAVAEAARARARAIRLRGEAAAVSAVSAESDVEDGAAESDDAELADPAEPATDSDEDADEVSDTASDGTDEAGHDAPTERRGRRLRLPRLRWEPLAASVALLVTVGLLAASGFMIWQHRQAQADQQREAEFAAAARQGVVTLMSLDFTKAEENIQQIIDSTTGDFKADFEATAEDFAKIARESEVVTEVDVKATAVDSMTDEEAVVLVAATSRVSNTSGADDDPRNWRLAVGLAREGDQIKMSKVEFVP